jgi:hypothetical protein
LTRVGPANDTGETRFDQTGSIRMFKPAVCSSHDAWPMNESRHAALSTRRGGRSLKGLAAQAGQGARSRVARKRSSCTVPCGGAPLRSKKRRPSKWSDTGPS